MRDAISPLAARFRPRFWAGLDVAAACLLGSGSVATVVAARPRRDDIPLWVMIVVELLIVAPVAFRRRWPRPSLVWVLASAAAGTAIAGWQDPFVAVALVMYVAVLAAGWPAMPLLIAALAVAEAGVFSSIWVAGTTARIAGGRAAIAVVAIVGAWFVGLLVRQKREYAATMAEHAAAAAVGGERLRIARELHDIVAHGLSLIAVQASVANYVGNTDSAQAHEALAGIEATSRASLRDLRHLLGVLRVGQGAAESAALDPAPGLADVPGLVRRTADAGVDVELAVCGERELPASVAVSVYRIVQEALTNVIKHAPMARTRVLLELGATDVRVEITCRGGGSAAGPARTGSGPGHGLIGMRERAALFGGELRAAPVPGGFDVVARLPVTDGAGHEQ